METNRKVGELFSGNERATFSDRHKDALVQVRHCLDCIHTIGLFCRLYSTVVSAHLASCIFGQT